MTTATAKPKLIRDRKGRQVIPEPAKIVGESGQVYGTLAEQGAETVTIKPIGKAYRPKLEKGGPAKQRSLTGDELIALGYSPEDFAKLPEDQKANVLKGLNDAQNASQAATVVKPKVSGQIASSVSASNTTPVVTTYGAAGVAQHQADEAARQAQQGVLDARAQDLAVSGGLVPAATASTAAARAANAATQRHLDEQARASAAAEADERRIQGAEKNVANLTTIGRAASIRSEEDAYKTAAGVPVAVDVNLPLGERGVAGPGVRAGLRTQAELLREQAEKDANLRGYSVERARIEAGKASSEAGLANVTTQEARDRAFASGLQVQDAQLAADRARAAMEAAGAPPFPGAVFDAETGEWVTEGQMRLRSVERSVTRSDFDPVNKEQVSLAELRSRTDAHGNILRKADGVWVDPASGNEFRDGIWTDPQTGSRLIQGVWTSPEGYRLLGGRWFNPAIGMFLIGSGVWEDPRNGDRIYPGIGFVPGRRAGPAYGAEDAW